MTKEKGRSGRYMALLACGGGFLAGTLCGWLLAAWMPPGDRAALADYLAGYGVALLAGEGLPGFLSLLWNAAKWPLLALLLGFSGLGVVTLPPTFALRGFFLSYCVAGLVRAAAGKGALLALVLFGVESIFALPILFVLGTQSWYAARGLRGQIVATVRSKALYRDGYWLRCLWCGGLLLLGALVEYVALPPILSAVAPFLLNG